MFQNARGEETMFQSVIDCSLVQLFSCLSVEAQDVLLAVMREMVAANKAKQAS